MRLRFLVFAALGILIALPGCGRKKAATTQHAVVSSESAAKVPRVAPKPRVLEVSERFKNAHKARLDDTYVIVILANGSKTLVPLTSLAPDDLAWLTQLAKDHPLPQGKSSMVVVASTESVKKTIEVSKMEGRLETVQLCPPGVIRNQIGGTCMMYARVHWLDIAGFPVDLGAIYKIINDAPSDHPWMSPSYVEGLRTIMTNFKTKPKTHRLPPQEDAFNWARQELRHGRPILAAFPREVWQALPPGFVAEHPWNGGSVGHQIVLNGFTWNADTQQGTFHVINSWKELMEFDLTTEAAQGGTLVIEQSLSPRGEEEVAEVKETVQTITFLKSAGSTNLYEVQTNLGTRRIAAPSEEKARELAEEGH